MASSKTLAQTIVQRLHRKEQTDEDAAASAVKNRSTTGSPLPDHSRTTIVRNVLHSRPPLAQGRFDDAHEANFDGTATSCMEQVFDFFSVGVGGRLVFSANCAFHSFLSFFPIIEVLKSYSLKHNLLPDIITGLTVTVMQIPQGMAYGLLAGLTPVIGLYVSLIPVLIYFVLGTSKYVSVGTFAVISIMVSGPVIELANLPPSYVTTWNSTASDTGLGYEVGGRHFPDGLSFRIAVATSLALLIGIMQTVAGFLRFGFVTVYLNEPMLNGFTTGAAIHVAISQIKYVLGISPSINGIFKITRTIIAIIQQANQFQLTTFIVSVVCIVSLFVLKEFVQPQFRKLKLPLGLNMMLLPFDLLVILIALLVSHFANLKGLGVAVVGTIPPGLPPVTLPVFSLWGSLFVDAIIIAIVSYAVTISLTILFANKYNLDLDANQEMIALGASNVISSFFSCYPGCASLSRSLMADSGGGTQLTGLVSAIGLVVVILFLAPLLNELPKCVLAAVILVALKGMFMQFAQLPHLWRTSLVEFLIWVVTFLATVGLDVDYGLCIGFVFSLLTIVLRTQSPHCSLLGRIPHTDIYKDILVYKDAHEIDGVKIFRFEGSLYFASCDKFREKAYLRTGVNPRELICLKEKALAANPPPKAINPEPTQLELKNVGHAGSATGVNSTTRNSSGEQNPSGRDRGNLEDSLGSFEYGELSVTPASGLNAISGKPDQTPVHHVIIDCSTWAYIDLAGIRVLKQVCDEYKKAGIVVFLAVVKGNVQKFLVRSKFYEKYEKNNVFLTVHDAVLGALRRHPALLTSIILDSPFYPITNIRGSDSRPDGKENKQRQQLQGDGTRQSVLTLRQMPLGLSQTFRPPSSMRENVQVTQISIEPLPDALPGVMRDLKVEIPHIDDSPTSDCATGSDPANSRPSSSFHFKDAHL